MMKIRSTILAMITTSVLFAGCGLDNYDAPESTLTGTVTYNNQAVQVRGTDGAVQLQLYQDGWQKRDAIPVFVGQDGKFSAKLFDGEYKLITRDRNGPWVNNRTDTIRVTVKGSTSVDVPVMPYFTISNENITLSGFTVTATFTVNKVVESAQIDKAMLILSKTQFADDTYKVLLEEKADAVVGTVTFSVNTAANANVTNAKALYGRVAVKAKGADQAIYSPTKKLR